MLDRKATEDKHRAQSPLSFFNSRKGGQEMGRKPCSWCSVIRNGCYCNISGLSFRLVSLGVTGCCISFVSGFACSSQCFRCLVGPPQATQDVCFPFAVPLKPPKNHGILSNVGGSQPSPLAFYPFSVWRWFPFNPPTVNF